MCMKKAAGGGGGKLDRILRERGAKQGGVLIVQPPSHQEFSKKRVLGEDAQDCNSCAKAGYDSR